MQEMVFLVIFPLLFFHEIHGQVTVPPSTNVTLGDDVPLVCTSTEANPIFTWTYVTDSQGLYTGSIRTTTGEKYDNMVLREGTDAQTSILDITDIQIEDDGEYRCGLTTESTQAPVTVVNVEKASSLEEINLISIDNYANYQASYNAIGSKPEETITWILNGVEQTAGIVESDPDISDDTLFDKRSMFTFPASLENYDVTLVCDISGHQVPSLNRQISRRVDVQNPPYPKGIEIGFNSDGTDLVVTCNTNDTVPPAIPPMDSFYIYSNGTLLTKQVSENSVTVTEPEGDTEFMCVGGNYLGNTSATQTFIPGRTTTPPPTTASGTTRTTLISVGDGNNDARTEGGSPSTTTETNEPGVTKPRKGGLSDGAIAGIAVGAILFIVIIIVLIIIFVLKPDCVSGSPGSTTTKTTTKHGASAVGSSNGNEKEKIRPEAAPRSQGAIKHTTDNPGQDMYAMVEKRPQGGDAPDARAGQNEPAGMHYADLDLSAGAGHTDRRVPKNEDGVVVYSSILV